MGNRRYLKCLILALVLIAPVVASAQVQVKLDIPRRLYMIYEPVIVRVSIKNFSGRDIVLRDGDGKHWFNFDILHTNGAMVMPKTRNYELNPLELKAGQTLQRKINLTPLYAMQEYGGHRIRANVYLADTGTEYTSNVKKIEITEGHLMWQQEVGVPGSTDSRLVSLLSFRLPQGDRLYIRIADEKNGVIYSNAKLGRLLSLYKPQIVFGRENVIHVLHHAAPRNYLYTKMNLDGEVLERETYLAPKYDPVLRVNEDQMVFIVGGVPEQPRGDVAGDRADLPKLSDRPPELPQVNER